MPAAAFRGKFGRVPRIVAMDFGIQAEHPQDDGLPRVRRDVVPAGATAAEILTHAPDGVFLRTARGPGRRAVHRPTVARSSEKSRCRDLPRAPDHGACVGGKTFKLKFGHHGCNQR